MKPWGISYGIDLPRVTKAGRRAPHRRRIPEKAKKALASAIDGYSVLALTADLRVD